MAVKEHSLDISAKLDMQEMKNAVIQAQKEIDNRYDFKGISKEIDLNVGAKTLTLISSSDNKIDAMLDIMISKMNKRDISINSLEELKKEDSSGGNRKYSYKIIDSIEKDEAKRIQTEIKNLKLKVSAVNQGDTIRVTGKNIDDLQAIMKHLKYYMSIAMKNNIDFKIDLNIPEDINIDNLLIVLKEQYSNNRTNLVNESKEKLEQQLKKLLPDDFAKKKTSEIQLDEIGRLTAVNDFKSFKTKVIEKYRGKDLGNYMPGFDEEVIIKVDEESSYLYDTTAKKIISKEESLEIWKYLYKNRDKVGKVIKKEPVNLIEQFINKIIFITKNDSFGNKEIIKYIVTDIKEETDSKGIIKYRLHINNLEDPTQDVEKSKTLLTFEQIKLFIEENSVEKDYSLHNE